MEGVSDLRLLPRARAGARSGEPGQIVQHALEERGDRLDRERLVDHVALFDSEPSATAAAESLRALGFSVDPTQTRSNGLAVEFHRTEALDGFRSDEFVLQILDAIEEHSGRYDGWGAPIAH